MNPLHCHDPLPEELAIIADALIVLTPRQREAVELYRYGSTQIEIAIELQITQQEVSKLLKIAFERLRGL